MWNDETSHCGGELNNETVEVVWNDETSHCGGELCGTMNSVTVEVS